VTAHRTLSVDGEEVGRSWLAAAVRDLRADLRAAGAGPGAAVRVVALDPLVTLAALVAGEQLECATAFCGDTPRAPLAVPVCADVVETRRGSWEVRPLPAASGRVLDPHVRAIFWTSGTTGDVKAPMISAAGLDFQLAATAERLELGRDDGAIVPLPLWHAYGHSVARLWLHRLAHLAVVTRPSAAVIGRVLADRRYTTLDGVPGLYAALLRSARKDGALRGRLAALRVCGVGGDMLPGPLAREWLELAGRPLLDGYGLSEAGPNVALNGPSDWRSGTVGRPLPGVRVSRDAERGELIVDSPSCLVGYADAADDTGKGGPLHTGDIGSVDADGYVRIDGRLKHAIVVHGETIAPAVIEDALRAAPGVDDVAVVGVRNAQRGTDIIVAVLEAHGVASTAGDNVRALAAQELPLRMRPSRVVTVARLPRLANGKVDRIGAARLAAGAC
jgi:malonyl-CoA/methylmalonyl-CoA synthetase